ncbi:hypothetical protein XI03_20825 [Bradyrhizobium sp. CCBAU 65884]|nr:hypothetical protein [Bradyrhizobium sp. CCBAU 65884]MDA9476885.1 hypothetical protein [Bradyrhizobium sp. CCBAU 65884]
MLNPATTALVRAVLGEICGHIATQNTGARAHVASKVLEAASGGYASHERLRQIGREALTEPPTMRQ